jgi:hypothetical protein
MAFEFEPGGETAELGGFAGAVETLEGDEVTARHIPSLPQARMKASNHKKAGGERRMLTFIWIGAAVVLIIVALFAYSSRNKKAPESRQEITATDVAMSPDRKRATGQGED